MAEIERRGRVPDPVKGAPHSPVGRRFRDRLTNATPVILIACAAMMLVSIVLSISALRALDRIETAEKKTCARLQVLRDGVNGHGRILYKMNGTIANIVRGPLGPLSARPFSRLAGRVDYFRQTDCQMAVEQPNSYVPPNPIPWEDYEQLLKRLPGPSADPRITPQQLEPTPTP